MMDDADVDEAKGKLEMVELGSGGDFRVFRLLDFDWQGFGRWIWSYLINLAVSRVEKLYTSLVNDKNTSKILKDKIMHMRCWVLEKHNSKSTLVKGELTKSFQRPTSTYNIRTSKVKLSKAVKSCNEAWNESDDKR